MRTLYIPLILTALFVACDHQASPKHQQPSDKPAEPLSDSARAVESVQHLLKWYRTKYDSLDRFSLVNIHRPDDSVPPDKDTEYNSVNFPETARYLNALRTSGFFTEDFLAEKQAYFRRCDSFFTVKKERNGSPTGFDRDILLSSSNTDEFFDDTIAPNIVMENPQTVIYDKYLVFSLKKSGDTCRIDNIRFISDPDSATEPVYTRGADSTDPLIRSIKNEFGKIEADHAKFRSVKKDIMDQSTEGGDGTLDYDGKQLRRARLEYFGETGKAYYMYYFSHGKIIFCFSRETRYTKPFYIENYSIGLIKTTRYYFQNGRLVRVIDEKGKLVDKSLYPEKQKDLSEADSAFLPTFNP